MVPICTTNTSPAHNMEVLVRELKTNPSLFWVSFLDVAYTMPLERLLTMGKDALLNCPIRLSFKDPKGDITKWLLAKPSVWLFGKCLHIQYHHPFT